MHRFYIKVSNRSQPNWALKPLYQVSIQHAYDLFSRMLQRRIADVGLDVYNRFFSASKEVLTHNSIV